MTCDQAKSKQWFRFRAGRITASRFRQVLHTDPDKPSKSLLKSICYPEINRFTTEATVWGCEHEKDAPQAYHTKLTESHEGVVVCRCGFYISLEHPFVGAPPDALVDCKCCGKGVAEIKCSFRCQDKSFVDVAGEDKTFCLQLSNGTLKLNEDHDYYYQCQIQIVATNRSFCDFVVWSSEELHIE